MQRVKVILNQAGFANISRPRCPIHAVFFLLCRAHQELHFKKKFIQIWSLDHEIIIINPLYYTNNCTDFANISRSRCPIHAVFFLLCRAYQELHFKKKFIQIWLLNYKLIILNQIKSLGQISQIRLDQVKSGHQVRSG